MKCTFETSKVNYLGQIVSRDGVAPDPVKLISVKKKFPAPKDVDGIRSFLGLASYSRRFIKNFAEKAHALSSLTKKNSAWQWGPTEQKAFDTIKTDLTTAPILSFPYFTRAFIVHTDASGFGVGAVLSQIQTLSANQACTVESPDDSKQFEEPPDGSGETVIAYTSKHLSDTQAKWSTTEKEAFAIIHAVKTFYHYLYGTNFTIVTDHRPLEYLMSKKDPTGRLARWALFLQQFNITIRYRPGKTHQNADCLSRIPVNLVAPSNFQVSDWIEAQKEDSFCKIALDKTVSVSGMVDSKRNITDEDNFITLPSGLLATASGKIVVPAKLQKEIMERYHDHLLARHLGVQKTLANIRWKYFWPQMNNLIRIHVNNCFVCAKRQEEAKPRFNQFPLQSIYGRG